MIEYAVYLKRFQGSPRPDVCVFADDDRETAIRAMASYVKHNGFTVHDQDGWFTVSDVVLVEKERIVGAPVLSVTSYCKLFDVCGDRKKEDAARRAVEGKEAGA